MLDYKKMLGEINDLVETPMLEDLESRVFLDEKDITQEEARELLKIVSSTYLIAHCIHCEACGKKYLTFKSE